MVRIYTTKDTFIFEGKDAETVYKGVNDAGARGAKWTTPIKLLSGKFIVFVLENIIAIEYE